MSKTEKVPAGRSFGFYDKPKTDPRPEIIRVAARNGWVITQQPLGSRCVAYTLTRGTALVYIDVSLGWVWIKSIVRDDVSNGKGPGTELNRDQTVAYLTAEEAA